MKDTSALRVLVMAGTRPEVIKLAPVIKALEDDPRTNPIVCLTGQHSQMVLPMVTLFGLRVAFELNIMRENQSLNSIAGSILEALPGVLRKTEPHILLVQGDTTTAMASAVAAFNEKVPIGHVEAGLRTGDMAAPWPEEANRKLIGAIASLHFAPTESARQSLLKENVGDRSIFVTGNTVIDALFAVKGGVERDPDFMLEMNQQFPRVGGSDGRYLGRNVILVTGHRRESFGPGLENICQALRKLAARGDVYILYPVHLNPNVQKPVKQILGGVTNIELIEPVDYRRFVYLMSRSRVILTDSGGIQEEAPALGKPVLVMREVTERPEGIAGGTVTMVGTDVARIVAETELLLDDEQVYAVRSQPSSPYGDGKASRRIVDALLRWHQEDAF